MPNAVDTVVIGGGTSGATVAGILAEGSDERVLVLEAGPDHGAYESGTWPADLLDARALAYSHDWGYTSGDTYPARVVNFERAKVVGGCSAHNGCAAIWGSRIDYDDWAGRGLDGWATADLLPFFESATTRLRVRTYDPGEVTPFQRACLSAAEAIGVPITRNLNDLDEDEGIAPSPVNIWQGQRWNSAFSYLDPARGRSNLTVVGNAMVDRLIVESGRARAVQFIGPSGAETIAAERFVLSGGTYGSPAILMRSGIGEPNALSALGIEPSISLPGVGQNLHDHPAVSVEFSGTRGLEEAMNAFAAEHWMPEEQTIAKLRSRHYPAGAPGFDLHIYPVGGPDANTASGWHWFFPVACMTPRSRGSLTLQSTDPAIAPRIEHQYITDTEGHDRRVLVDGVRIARDMAASPELRELLGDELVPGLALTSEADIGQWVGDAIGHYYHPVGTCAMGLESEPLAVTNARGRVHGLDNVFVADCSIMPVIPRANTNVPAVVVGERIANWLLADSAR